MASIPDPGPKSPDRVHEGRERRATGQYEHRGKEKEDCGEGNEPPLFFFAQEEQEILQ